MSSNIYRSLLELSTLQYFYELKFGCYFKVNSGSHFFVSTSTLATPYDFPLTFCEPESAVQNGGNNLIVDPGEILYVLGEFRLNEGAGIQLKGCKVLHNIALNVGEYNQLLTDLKVAKSAANYSVEVSMTS
jgi:hypothetical protein